MVGDYVLHSNIPCLFTELFPLVKSPCSEHIEGNCNETCSTTFFSQSYSPLSKSPL